MFYNSPLPFQKYQPQSHEVQELQNGGHHVRYHNQTQEKSVLSVEDAIWTLQMWMDWLELLGLNRYRSNLVLPTFWTMNTDSSIGNLKLVMLYKYIIL